MKRRNYKKKTKMRTRKVVQNILEVRERKKRNRKKTRTEQQV